MTPTEAESKGVGVSQVVVSGLGDLVEDLEVELGALNALLFGLGRRDSTSIYLVITLVFHTRCEDAVEGTSASLSLAL
jgi:hypothetical protein